MTNTVKRKAKKRPAISDGMKYRALKLHGAVRIQCMTCLAMSQDGHPVATWHSLANIQFDHVWELADGGEHGAKHLRPMCVEHHKRKTTRNEKMRHHLDRAGKKQRGEWKAKKPMAHPTLRKKLNGEVVPK